MIIDPQKIIINRRGSRNRGDVLLSVSLPLVFWGVMIYLAHPLAAFMSETAAGLAFDPARGRPEPLTALLSHYLPVITGLSFSLFGWALYNRLRFRGSRDKRRVPPPSLTLGEVAAGCPFGPAEVRLIRRAEVSFFFFDDKGAVVAVKCRRAETDTDHTLAQAAALACRMAAGQGRPEISEAPRIPSAPLARPLRPVSDVIESRSASRPLPGLAAVRAKRFSGGVSPRL